MSFLAQSLGLVAGLFFCLGSARLRPSRIRDLAGTYWDSNPHLMAFLVALKTDYFCGAIALVASFVLQLPTSIPGVLPSSKLFLRASNGVGLAALIVAACVTLLFFLRHHMILHLKGLASAKADET